MNLSEPLIETCDICHHHHPKLPSETPADELVSPVAVVFIVWGAPC